MEKPLVLISNDDGVHAPGIQTLAEEISKQAEVYVVAPHVERSATSHAITIVSPMRLEKLPDRSFCRHVWAAEGTPVDSVVLGLRKVLPRKPDWVISGVNRGGNLGVDTIYSGTVGAAMEGALNNIPSMAVSSHGQYGDKMHYETAAELAGVIFSNRKAFEFPEPFVINLNVPTVPMGALRGVRTAVPGRRIYEDFVYESSDPRGLPYFWHGAGGRDFVDIPGSDCNIIDQGFATISILKPSLLDEKMTNQTAKILEEIF